MNEQTYIRGGLARIMGTLLALSACFFLAVPTEARSERRVEVRGRVSDSTGAPVPGHVVRLLKSRTIVSLRGMKTEDQDVEEMRTTADARGFYEFSFPVDPKFRYYYLRFYDPGDFDVVKYVLPKDMDVSRRARKGRPVQADVVLQIQATWPEVKEFIDLYGPWSHRGQILRALGLPSRRTPQGAGRELWEYDAAGVSYLIEGAKVLETRRSTATADPEDPAVQVGDPMSSDGGRR